MIAGSTHVTITRLVIHFVTPRGNAFGLFNYIEDHNPSLADRIRPMSYEALTACDALPALSPAGRSPTAANCSAR